VFDDARGVQPGAYVRLRGVDIGQVEGVDFAVGGRPEVTMRIDDRFQVRREDSVRIVGGVLGFSPPYVEIIPGGRLNPPRGGLIVGESSPGAESLIVEADKLLKNLNELASNLNRVTTGLADVTADRRLRTSLLNTTRNFEQVTKSGVVIARNMESATARADRLIAGFQKASGSLDRTLRETEAMMAGFRGTARESQALMSDARGVVRDAGTLVKETTTAVESTGELVADTRSLLNNNRERLTSVLANLDAALKQLDGTLAEARSFIGDQGLREDFKQTAANLRTATETLKQITTDVRGLTGDSKVQEDLKATVSSLRDATTDAGRLFQRVREVLGGSGNAAKSIKQRLAEMQFDVSLLRSVEEDRTRLDFDATIPWSARTAYRVGFYDFGEGNKFNVQAAQKVRGNLWTRYGIHASTLGFGLDYGGARKPFSMDLYGVDRPRLDVRGGIALRPYLDLVLGFDNVLRRADPVLGLRYRK